MKESEISLGNSPSRPDTVLFFLELTNTVIKLLQELVEAAIDINTHIIWTGKRLVKK